MAKYGPASLKVEYDNSGGTLVDISQHVLEINDVSVENLMEMTRTFGDSWDESLPIGVGKMSDVTISGVYDDTASTAPDALFANRIPELPGANTRTLKLTWGGTKTTSVETVLMKYDRTADRTALTKWSATLRPTGAVTEV
jgi:hypothetical protein